MRVNLVLVLALLGLLPPLPLRTSPAADKIEELTPEQRKELDKKGLDLKKEGLQQLQRGNLVKATELFLEVLALDRTLYPKKDFPDGHLYLAASINNLAFLYKTAGNYGKAEPLYREALAMYRQLFPRDKYPDGHPTLATSISNLASLHEEVGDHGKAEPLRREALAMCRQLFPRDKYPDGHPDLARNLHNLAFLHQAAGDNGNAEPLCREALTMRRQLFPREKFPAGHTDLAHSIVQLASLRQAAGDSSKAEPLSREALAMCRQLYPREKFPAGHPDLAFTINNLASLHQDAGDYGKAEPLYREALTMRRQLFPRDKYPAGHTDLAHSINNLAALYWAARDYGKAEPLFREALTMRRQLFPREKFPAGHTDLAMSIYNFAALHQAVGDYGKAEPLLREALSMRRQLFSLEKYPAGHADLAGSLNNLGLLYKNVGNDDKAEPLLREALAMCRTLYPMKDFPDGHPELAISINNLASLYQDAGDYGKAGPLCREALRMCRRLFPPEKYPNGHIRLAASINNLAFLHKDAGDYGQAEPLLREALAMFRQLLRQYAELAAEAESLNFTAGLPLTLDALLSTQRQLPYDPTSYDALWNSRAVLTRLQERRHRDLMASHDKATAALADELRLTRQALARLVLNPSRDADARPLEIEKLTQVKEDLEKRIANKLHLDALRSVAPVTSVKRLCDALPADAAFVDLIRYFYYEQDPRTPGKKGERLIPSYVAFVVRKDQPTARIELKEAKAIGQAWSAWHKALTAPLPDVDAERTEAARFAKLVWEPIRAALPADCKTVYLTPAGALAQVPWAALPGRKEDTVLLDECAVCLVPHGPWLLERLEEKAAQRRWDTLLVYGGVDYAESPEAVLKGDDVRAPLLGKKRINWLDLPGTERERAAVAELAAKVLKDKPIARGGRDASTAQLVADLPRARYAHVATHGFFADPEFRSALQMDARSYERRTQDRRGGARSPLVLSGLVLAGANRQGEDAAPDRGIITAEGLIGLRLEGLELAVLSACETGLGEAGGGEGVYGLQRAFHVAGCKNVIASLWKVDDAATQALMVLFYRNLWEKKLDPAEALRQAQLTLYRHPEAVEVAKKRGVDFGESDLPAVDDRPKGKRAPAAHWAAFTFSGMRPAK
jgi:CHAT domain-containing protein